MARPSDSEHGIRSSLAFEMLNNKPRWTVRSLSEASGVNLGTVSRLRSNNFAMVDCATLEKLCRFLNLEIGELLHLEPPLGIELEEWEKEKAREKEEAQQKRKEEAKKKGAALGNRKTTPKGKKKDG